MPTLLLINECLHFSTGRITQQIGEAALASGWESYIAYSVREPKMPSKSLILKVGHRFSPVIHYIENLLFDREGLSSRYATRRLIKQIKEICPDVIHLHNIHDHWLNYKILFGYLNTTDIKVVWTFHDCWAFTGHCFHFVTKGCERWKTECHHCPLQKEYPKTYIDCSRTNYKIKKSLFCANKNLTIVACSEWLANLVRHSFLKDKRIQVINNGIDLSVFRPLGKKTDNASYRILAVSNVWNKEKGFFDIIKLREHLTLDYEITIVGLSKEQLNSLPEGIKGIERTQNVEEMVRLYSESNVLINPTYADTFPSINIEALACGTPVITYKTGGSPEIIDANTGVVVNQGDVNGMAQAIIDLRSNPLSSEACRKRAELNYDKGEKYHEYIMLYEELISK